MPQEITLEVLEMAYDIAIKSAVQTFNEEGEAPPALLLFSFFPEESGQKNIMALVDPELINSLQRTPMHKAIMTEMIRATLEGHGPLFDAVRDAFGGQPPQCAVHVTEAWVVHLEGRPTEGRKNMPPPSEHPDRRECILANVHVVGKTWGGMCPVDPKTRKASYEPLDVTKYTSFSGAMTMQGAGHSVQSTN